MLAEYFQHGTRHEFTYHLAPYFAHERWIRWRISPRTRSNTRGGSNVLSFPSINSFLFLLAKGDMHVVKSA